MEDGGVGCSVACSRISSPHPKIQKKHSNLLHHKTQKTTRGGGHRWWPFYLRARMDYCQGHYFIRLWVAAVVGSVLGGLVGFGCGEGCDVLGEEVAAEEEGVDALGFDIDEGVAFGGGELGEGQEGGSEVVGTVPASVGVVGDNARFGWGYGGVMLDYYETRGGF